MPEAKLDYKKRDRTLYSPTQKPALVDVPDMQFVTIEGKGAPDGELFQNSIQALYSISYTIKMSKMSGEQPEGYFEYVVPPLEGLWWMGDGTTFDTSKPEEWCWKLMIRQPEFVTKSIFEQSAAKCKSKNPHLTLIDSARLVSFEEGLCVQIMHIGKYHEEQTSIDKIMQFISDNKMVADMNSVRKHHEIYLNDPRKCDPDKIKTVLRIPVKISGAK